MNKWAILPFLFLTACMVGPTYKPPTPYTPDEWKHSQEEISYPDAVCNFWDIFEDELLNDLENQAIERNPNLGIAIARVEEAWGLAGISRGTLFPQINLQPQYQNTGMLSKIYLPSSVKNNPLLGPIEEDFRIHQMNFTLPLNMTYEVDLWGKYRSRYYSRIADVQAREEAYRTALLSLTTQVASAYYHSRVLDKIIEITVEQIRIREEDFSLAQNRFKKGLGNELNVLRAESDVDLLKADLLNFQQQREQYVIILATLIGLTPGEFCLTYNPVETLPPQIPAGIPCQVIAQRPDIAEAERIMAREHWMINSAYSELLPSFTLTGTLGYYSPDFKHFMTWFSRLWSIGVNANQPIFDAGQRFSQIDASWAAFAQSSWSYQQKVLTALQEVETTLSNLEYEREKYTTLDRAVKNSVKARNLSRLRYNKGIVAVTEYNEAFRTSLNAEIGLLNVVDAQYQSTIQLIKALGGTFSFDPCESGRGLGLAREIN